MGKKVSCNFVSMGVALTKVWARLVGKFDARILMVGLDAAGKTTVLYNLKLGEVVTTIPTIGFNVETGEDKIRKLWRHYYMGMQGAIFVVDSCDHDRMDD